MIDDSKQASLKKELISYMSIYYDKKNLKEQNKIADDILKVFNEDKKFRDKVEKIAKKINDIKKAKKGGRRNKTRKNKKGGNGDYDFLYPIAIIAAATVIGYGLLQVARAIEGGVEQWRRSNVMAEERERQGENFTSQTTPENTNRSPPRTPPRQVGRIINPGLRSRRGNARRQSAFVGSNNNVLDPPGGLTRQFSNRTAQMYARLGQQDALDFETAGLSSFTPVRSSNNNSSGPPDMEHSPPLQESSILGTPQVYRPGTTQYGLRRRTISAPPTMQTGTSSSSDPEDEDYVPYPDGIRLLHEHRLDSSSDSESAERPAARRHHSSHMGGRKRHKTRKKRRRKK